MRTTRKSVYALAAAALAVAAAMSGPAAALTLTEAGTTGTSGSKVRGDRCDGSPKCCLKYPTDSDCVTVSPCLIDPTVCEPPA